MSTNVTSSLLPGKRRLLATAAVASRLGISSRTIRLWAECGEMPAVKVGKQWRFDEGALEHWLLARAASLSGSRSGVRSTVES